jgi:Rieske Fe-S protein
MTVHPRAPLPVLETGDSLSRRDFLTTSAAAVVAAALTGACGDSATGPTGGRVTAPPGSVTFANGVLAINLDAVPALAATNGYVIVGMNDAGGGRADVIVLNLGGEGYRALSSICTHEGCTVSSFTNGRVLCACHGSEFDRNGTNVAGPAPRPLRQYATALDTARRTLTVTVT